MCTVTDTIHKPGGWELGFVLRLLGTTGKTIEVFSQAPNSSHCNLSLINLYHVFHYTR